ncbi:hypothetical protein HDV00_002672 [Rhizophlyctis rosea]|nr:hypothetical protein HDV00_002672 [Rhizophlyctis rosea]
MTNSPRILVGLQKHKTKGGRFVPYKNEVPGCPLQTTLRILPPSPHNPPQLPTRIDLRLMLVNHRSRTREQALSLTLENSEDFPEYRVEQDAILILSEIDMTTVAGAAARQHTGEKKTSNAGKKYLFEADMFWGEYQIDSTRSEPFQLKAWNASREKNEWEAIPIDLPVHVAVAPVDDLATPKDQIHFPEAGTPLFPFSFDPAPALLQDSPPMSTTSEATFHTSPPLFRDPPYQSTVSTTSELFDMDYTTSSMTDTAFVPSSPPLESQPPTQDAANGNLDTYQAKIDPSIIQTLSQPPTSQDISIWLHVIRKSPPSTLPCAKRARDRNLLHLFVQNVINNSDFAEFTDEMGDVVRTLCEAGVSCADYCYAKHKTLSQLSTVLHLLCDDPYPPTKHLANLQERKKVAFCEAVWTYAQDDFLRAANTFSMIEKEGNHLPIHNAAWRRWNDLLHWICNKYQEHTGTDLLLTKTAFHKARSTIAHIAADVCNLDLLKHLASNESYRYMFRTKNGFQPLPTGVTDHMDVDSDGDESEEEEVTRDEGRLNGCTPYEMVVRALRKEKFEKDIKRLRKAKKWFETEGLAYKGCLDLEEVVHVG